MAPERLKKRSDFQKAAKGKRFHAASFSMQMAPRADVGGEPRVGLTVTKKEGGSTERNRIRRRLREVFRLTPALSLLPAHDYVLVARRAALATPFTRLVGEVEEAVRVIHRSKAQPRRDGPKRDQAKA